MSTDEVYGSTEQIVDVNLLNPANFIQRIQGGGRHDCYRIQNNAP